ncbi:diaminobutyrate acetyltransferase [Thalassospiraceae bacterium LMO-JJ14]|nr:diaminobutyrate acetyltransferase [Thalassospiraceae bacterium LMO-JJ14]
MTISERLDRIDSDLILRRPTPEDGVAVNELVEQCKPLDENSVYCNLLQCSHFSQTSALAELDGDVAGFVSGYVMPEHEDSLFVWQVAVAPEARGLSLAKRMVFDILRRPSIKGIRHIKTTITPDNKASHGVFKSIARELGADIERDVLFDREEHFDGQQKTEMLWNIGPFKRSDLMPVLSRAA